MKSRPLMRLDVAPGSAGALAVADALVDALAGTGPAIAPIPVAPRAHAERIVRAVRPDDSSAPLESDAVALCVATAGSVGQPRGVLLTSEQLIASAQMSDHSLGDPARWLLALPVDHIAGIQVLVRSHLSGLPPVIMESLGGGGRFTPEEFANAARAARAMCDADGAQLRTALVPTQLIRVLDAGRDGVNALGAFDAVLVGGATTPSSVIERAHSRGIKLITTYGMTESAGGCVYDGHPLPGVSVTIGDADSHGLGRIELKGPNIALGYRLRPADTAESFVDGKFLTNDVGRLKAGLLHVRGRRDDVVQVGGMNVSLPAIDDCLSRQPGVSQAASVAQPDDQWGSRITSFVVLRQPVSEEDAGDLERLRRKLTQSVAKQLGTEARPRSVVLVPSLPTLPSGKIDRSALSLLAAQPTTNRPQV
ncbi:MAG: AMP-binding protein [Candidatus Nanopelagicales bacterium]|nr:AMP-binding protein [Candidatus Nanopelagicales bacterium]